MNNSSNDKIAIFEEKRRQLLTEKSDLGQKCDLLSKDLEGYKQVIQKWTNTWNILHSVFLLYSIIFVIVLFAEIFLLSYNTTEWDNYVIHHEFPLANLGISILIVFIAFGVAVYYITYGAVKPKLLTHLSQFKAISFQVTSATSRIRTIETEINRLALEKEMTMKGFVSFVDRSGIERWGAPDQIKEWMRVDTDMKNGFQTLTPREFEKLVNQIFISMGYKSKLTKYVGDYGADIIAERGEERIAVQAKRYAADNKIGSPDIQKILGSMHKYKANKAIFVTTSSFTPAAEEQARNAPIELWDYRTLYQKIEKYLLKL